MPAKRARIRTGLLILLAATIAAATAALACTAGYASLSTTTGLRQFAVSAEGQSAVARLRTSLIGDGLAQGGRAAATFSSSGVSSGTLIFDTLQSYPQSAAPGVGSSDAAPERTTTATVTLVSWDQAADHVELRSGHLPSTANEVALPSDAAAGLGLHVGDSVAFSPAGITAPSNVAGGQHPAPGNKLTDPAASVFVVAGIFDLGQQAREVLKPIPDDSTSQGATFQTFGALVLPTVLNRRDSGNRVNWTILLDPSTVSATQLPVLIAAIPQLRETFADDAALGAGGVVLTDALAPALAQVRDAAEAVMGITPAALILLVLLGAVAIIQISTLLASARSSENDLLRARGLSAGGAIRFAAGEAIAISLAGVLSGYFLALCGTVLLTDPATGSGAAWWRVVAEASGATWGIPVVVFLASAAVMVLVGTRDVVRSPESRQDRDSGRSRQLASAGFVVVVAAAAVSLWQLDLYASPLTRDSNGTLRINPLAVGAPALAIMAGATAALGLFNVLSKGLERLACRARSLAVPFAVWQVARRAGAYTVPLLLIAVTAASGTLAGSYAQSYQESRNTASLLANGSSVNIRTANGVISGPADVSDHGQIRTLPGVRAVGEVYGASMDFGGQPVDLVAVQSGQLPGLLEPSVSATAPHMAATLDPTGQPDQEPGSGGPAGMKLPAGADSLSLRLTISGTGTTLMRSLDTTVWVDGASGLVPLHLEQLPIPPGASTTNSLTVPVPAVLGADRIASIDFLLGPTQPRGGPGPGNSSIRLDGISARTGEVTEDIALPSAPMQLQSFSESAGHTKLLTEASHNLVVVDNADFAAQSLRLMAPDIQGSAAAGGPVSQGTPDAIPVLVTDSVLRALDLKVGAALTLRPAGVSVAAVIAGTVPAVPGTSSALAAMVDLRSFQRQEWLTGTSVVKPNGLWVASSDPEATARAVRGLVARTAVVNTTTQGLTARFVQPSIVALWLGALGSLLLAAMALGASVLALVRGRETEVGLLRALGVPAAEQSRGRRRELLIVGLSGIIFGTAAGAVVAGLTVPDLAHSALADLPGAPPVRLVVALLPVAGVLMLLLVEIVAASWAYGRAVRRQALARPAAVEWR